MTQPRCCDGCEFRHLIQQPTHNVKYNEGTSTVKICSTNVFGKSDSSVAVCAVVAGSSKGRDGSSWACNFHTQRN